MGTNILIWILKRAFNGKSRKKLEPVIKQLYKIQATENLELKTDIIKVKKGKRKYYILFFEDRFGVLKFILSRHNY